MEVIDVIVQQWQQQSIGEIFAVAFAVIYVWLAAEESIWCWPAAFISTSLFAYVFWDVSVVFQMLLNLYYMAMAVYGFFTWNKAGDQKLAVSRFSLKSHIKFISAGVALSLLVLLFSVLWFDYELIWLDIAITVFSLLTTVLTVRKVLECWGYWCIINLASMVLFYENQLYLSMILMLIYIVLAIKGFIQWRTKHPNASYI